jgi:hypothetical protein
MDERGAMALRPASLAVETASNSNAAVLMLPNKGSVFCPKRDKHPTYIERSNSENAHVHLPVTR